MGRKKLEDENIRKIQSSGGSYYISLPMRLMRKFGWKERQKVVVKEFGKDKIVISDWKK